MSQFAPRLSETELSQRILEMAQTGVYRESIFEAFRSLATQRQIRQAIAHAKQFGLYSVRDLRDPELGTFYQVDLQKYQSFQAALKAAVPLPPGDDLAAQMLAATQAIRAMLAIAGSCTFIFFDSRWTVPADRPSTERASGMGQCCQHWRYLAIATA